MSQATQVIPSKLKALYQRIIDNDAATRNDWHDVATEFCIVKDGKKTENTALKKERGAIFTKMHMAKNAPNAVDGTELYASVKKLTQSTWSTCVNRALVSLGHRATKQRSTPVKADSVDSGKASSTTPTATPAFSAEAMAMQHEIASRATSLREVLVAFQTMHQLNKKATEAIGHIAESARTLETKANELGELMIGKGNEAADKALVEALKASVAPKPADNGELEATELAETGITVETEELATTE